MHYTFHHIPKTGGSSLRIRLEDRANKKQISKLDYAIGHNTTKRTPGTHFTWLRNPLDRDISNFNHDMSREAFLLRAYQFITEAQDSDVVNELDLFIMNDEDLYRRRFMPIIENIKRKMKRGVYDHEKVIKLWMYLIDDAAKKYVQEFGTHFTWLRNPLDRDISQFTHDMAKGENKETQKEINRLLGMTHAMFKNLIALNTYTFEDNCRLLAGNFITLWIYKRYLLQDPNVDINSKYITVRQCLKNNFQRVFSTENFEQSWNEVADLLKIDREPRLNINQSHSDYKNLVSKENLSEEFLNWHRSYNHYDYKLFEEFCT